MIYHGGCHCGNVSFEVDGTLGEVYECNCSLCSKRGYLLWFVDRSQLQLQPPARPMTVYHFNTGKISHNFCPTCGCAPYGSAGDKVALNVRCLAEVDPATLTIKPVDGRSIPTVTPA